MATQLPSNVETGKQTALRQLNDAISDEMGGIENFGRLLAKELHHQKDRRNRKQQQCPDKETKHEDKMILNWSRVIMECIKNNDGQELDMAKMSMADQRQIEMMLLPLMLQKLESDPSFVDQVLVALLRRNPGALTSLSDKIHMKLVEVSNV